MPWKKTNETPVEELIGEMKRNLEDQGDSARLLIIGTEYSDGYRMRLSLRNPEAVVGIIYTHAIKTGELNEAVAMAKELIRIGMAAKKMIDDAVLARKLQN